MDRGLLRRASDRTAPAYDERFGALQRVKYEATLAACPEGDLRGGAWLDAGCGTGLLAERLANPGGDGGRGWTGVDLSAGMLERAARRGVRVVQADLDALPFADGAFDAAFSFTALVDRASAGPALPELARVVRAGGLVVVTVLRHDVPDDVGPIAADCGLVALAQVPDCGQDQGFVWRRR